MDKMITYPREISLQNGRVQETLDVRPDVVVNGKDSRSRRAYEIVVKGHKRDSSYSDIPRPFIGVDIRRQESDKTYLGLPNGGHLRAAFSEVEGLDRYGNKESQEDSSREMERSKDPEAQTDQQTQQKMNKSATARSSRPVSGLTPFEKAKADFEKRSQYKSEVRAGKRIGFYRFILDIGRGNFSKVKLATHTLLNAEVAVKVIDRTKFDAKTRRLLSQELANMERLNHPNVIQLYEVHEVPQRWHLIMEYAPVGELHSYLKRHGRLDDSMARTISSQIVSALKHMHAHGVVHRDLKAENVLFMTSSYIKVGDFGFSKHINMNDALTTFCGSPPYAAPELFVADSYIGPAVDLWALGVLIFYMTVGNLPFRGDSIAKIKRLILDGQVDYPPFLPTACRELIRGLLTHSVDARYGIAQTQRSPWFAGTDWSDRTRESRPLPDQVDDATVRGLLEKWWNVQDWELDHALEEGPRNSLTGIYRILRSHGGKYLDYKIPTLVRKTKALKRSRDRKREQNDSRHNHTHPIIVENERQRSKRSGLKRTEEVTTVDLRDKTLVKGKIDREGETTSRTCILL